MHLFVITIRNAKFLSNFSVKSKVNISLKVNCRYILVKTKTQQEKCPYMELENIHIQSECEEIRARKTPNTDTLYKVNVKNMKTKRFHETGLHDFLFRKVI